MSSERAIFLRERWAPYPSAPSPAASVGKWLRALQARRAAPDAAPLPWACGRLRAPPVRGPAPAGAWSLECGDARQAFRFAPHCAWHIEGGPAAESIWRDGDWAALRLDLPSAPFPLAAPAAPSGAAAGSPALPLATAAILLAPCLEPAPEASPGGGLALARGREWATFVASVRAFFVDRGFVEARTPTLAHSPGTEPYLDAFDTVYRERGSEPVRLYLPTSPEFHLKRLLAAGWGDIFALKDCFRNGEAGPSHEPEFAMLEWYRSFATLDPIADDAIALIAWCARALEIPEPPPARATTVRALFREALGFDLRPGSTAEELRALCVSLGQAPSADDAWEDLFFRAFLARIEPSLGRAGPVVVRDYPPQLAALARVKRDGWADRMELYRRGLELANGFHELSDPRENEARFAADRAVKARLGREPFPQDEALLAALRSGMPPSGGIALGLDRLFMALMECEQIGETRPFPFRAQ